MDSDNATTEIPAGHLVINDDKYETRPDGVVVRRDRWEWCTRRIVALLWGNRSEFEIDDVVAEVRKISNPAHHADEELVLAMQRLIESR